MHFLILMLMILTFIQSNLQIRQRTGSGFEVQILIPEESSNFLDFHLHNKQGKDPVLRSYQLLYVLNRTTDETALFPIDSAAGESWILVKLDKNQYEVKLPEAWTFSFTTSPFTRHGYFGFSHMTKCAATTTPLRLHKRQHESQSYPNKLNLLLNALILVMFSPTHRF